MNSRINKSWNEPGMDLWSHGLIESMTYRLIDSWSLGLFGSLSVDIMDYCSQES